MILNKDEVRIISSMFDDLNWSNCTSSARALWSKVDDEIKHGDPNIKLRTKELAKRWSMDKQSIVNMRKADRGPTYIKTDTGAILYDLADIIEYEKLRVIKPKHPI